MPHMHQCLRSSKLKDREKEGVCLESSLRAKLSCTVDNVSACLRAERLECRSGKASQCCTKEADIGGFDHLVGMRACRNAAKCGIKEHQDTTQLDVVQYGTRKCANRIRCRRNANLMRLTARAKKMCFSLHAQSSSSLRFPSRYRLHVDAFCA